MNPVVFDTFPSHLSEELNMSRLSSTGSSPSLSSGSAGGEAPSGVDGPASRVVGWAVCFERLMEDAVGVRYFTVRAQTSILNSDFFFGCMFNTMNYFDPLSAQELMLKWKNNRHGGQKNPTGRP